MVLISALAACQQGRTPASRSVENFNQGWRFSREDQEGWDEVQLPHIFQIEPLVVTDMWQGSAWYTKDFKLDLAEGQRALLRFGGVMHEADLWLNGNKLAHHEGGYLPFVVDITEHLEQENQLKVRVNNEDNPTIPPGKGIGVLDFSYYGGIYRDVTLTLANDVHITDAVAAQQVNGGGVLIHFNSINPDQATGLLKTHLQNDSKEDQKISLQIETDGHVWQSEIVSIPAGGDVSISQKITIDQPRLWSPQDPQLYEFEIKVLNGTEIVDELSEITGIRRIELSDEGFLLNGEKIYMRGTNRHQEYPFVGYALSDEAQYRDAVKIKNAGFDMVRLSHYPQDEAFLRACDELGIIVMNCMAGWQFFGDEVFIANSFQDIRDMARRDRNHPSIFFWEVSLNESQMTDEYMQKADSILKVELPYQDIYSAGWMDHPAYDLFIPARQHGQAPDYWNYYKEGDRKVFIAEYGDWEYYAQNAGFNQKAFKDLTEAERTSRQLRGDGEQRLLQQAMNYQEATNSNRKGAEVGTIGHANWLMFDYNRGYTDDIEASGISDIARIPKFAYYFYQSQRPASESYDFEDGEFGPMVKIANYWTENSPTTVRVFSNAEEVALYLNDSLIERKSATKDQYADHLLSGPFHFQLAAFEPGTLRAVAFIEGEEVAQDQVATAGEPAAIQLSIDYSGQQIAAQKADVLFVYASIVDEKGQLVTEATDELQFELIGENATLIGANPVKAEAGIATVLLRTEKFDSELKIKAVGKGLKGDELLLKP